MLEGLYSIGIIAEPTFPIERYLLSKWDLIIEIIKNCGWCNFFCT